MEGPRDAHGTAAQTPPTMHEEELIAVPTELNVVLAFLPKVVMAPMQTTMIRASMTAYSTAVGPSSRFRNRTTLLANFVTTMPPKDAGLRNPSVTPTPPGR